MWQEHAQESLVCEKLNRQRSSEEQFMALARRKWNEAKEKYLKENAMELAIQKLNVK